MPTWLHEIDTLVALQDDPDPFLADWATAHLAPRAPESLRRLPRSPALLMATSSVLPLDFDHLYREAAKPGALSLEDLADLGWWGVLLQRTEDLPALLEAYPRADPWDDFYAIELLYLHGLAGPADLARAAKLPGHSAKVLTVLLSLQLAGDTVSPTMADALVDFLEPDELERLFQDRGLPAALGPRPHPWEEAQRAAADLGAKLAVSPLAGAAQRRPERVILRLLDGVDGPDAEILRAVARRKRVKSAHVYRASWLRHRPSGPDPVAELCARLGAGPPQLVARARPLLLQSPPEASITPWVGTWCNLAAPVLRWHPQALRDLYLAAAQAEPDRVGPPAAWAMGAMAPEALEQLDTEESDLPFPLWGLCATEESLAELTLAAEELPPEDERSEHALHLALALLGDRRAREVAEQRAEATGVPLGRAARDWFQTVLPQG